jgi:Domain of unknown function (DUF4136)
MAKAGILVAMLALAACRTAHVSSDYDHGAQFSSFHSFTLIMRPHLSAKNPILVQRTYDSIRAELTSKGFAYLEDPAQADLAVDFTIGASDRFDVHSSPSGLYGGPWYYGGGWGNNVDVRQYKEGTLSIDVFEVRSRKPVWHGSGTKEISQSDLDNSEALIREAVTSVLADFPPKAT